MTWGGETRLACADPSRTVPDKIDDDPWFRHGGVRTPDRCELPWGQADRCPLPWAEVEA